MLTKQSGMTVCGYMIFFHLKLLLVYIYTATIVLNKCCTFINVLNYEYSDTYGGGDGSGLGGEDGGVKQQLFMAIAFHLDNHLVGQ